MVVLLCAPAVTDENTSRVPDPGDGAVIVMTQSERAAIVWAEPSPTMVVGETPHPLSVNVAWGAPEGETVRTTGKDDVAPCACAFNGISPSKEPAKSKAKRRTETSDPLRGPNT
jgi:hypothetical protein